MSSEIDLIDNLITSQDYEDFNLPAKNNTETNEETWSKNFNILETPKFKGESKLCVDAPVSAIGFFNLIFTNDFYYFLMAQINKRIQRKNDSQSKFIENNNSQNKYISLITISELKYFIAINFYMEIVKVNEIRSYWSSDVNKYGSKFIQDIMSYSRFTEINSNLSLASIDKSSDGFKRDIDVSTEKIINYLNNKFESLYLPNQEISIDEGMCKYQGRYGFKTYMPAKPIKVGIKFYLLADSKTSFICKFKLYSGKYQSIKDTVKELTFNYENKNHKLYMDNYYNSFSLCQELREKNIYTCGTMRMGRGEPKNFPIIKKNMKKGDFQCVQKDNINLLLWYDKKPVCFISTFLNIDSNLIKKEKNVFEKPYIIKDYDQNMGGVDIYD